MQSDSIVTALPIVKLATDKVVSLNELARVRQVDVAELLATAITEWLEKELKRQRAWQTLRNLSQGIEGGKPNNTVAREHDQYLYSKP